MTFTEHQQHVKQQHKQVRLKLVFDMIEKLFGDKRTLTTFDGNKITLDAGTIRLTAFYNQIDLEPSGVLVWTCPAKEMELKEDEEEYLKFSLKLHLQKILR